MAGRAPRTSRRFACKVLKLLALLFQKYKYRQSTEKFTAFREQDDEDVRWVGVGHGFAIFVFNIAFSPRFFLLFSPNIFFFLQDDEDVRGEVSAADLAGGGVMDAEAFTSSQVLDFTCFTSTKVCVAAA